MTDPSVGHVWFRLMGPDADVAMSTRIRLARNVDGYPFPGYITEEKRKELEAQLRVWIGKAKVADATQYQNVNALPSLERTLLVEKHVISRELANGTGDRGVTFGADDLVSVMTNEEDHLRIQVLRCGLKLREAFDTIREIDQKLEKHVPYAWHERFGYLTACPTNCGTGMRISVMLHLPTLVLMNQIQKVFQAATKVGLTVRGFYGEGTNASGDFFQISNQHTLGRTEEESLDVVERIVTKIVEYERGVRKQLMDSNRMLLEDKVWRSLGVLRYARKLTSEEAMELLSAVRLGVTMNLVPGLNIADVNELFVLTQPAHLQALKGRTLEAPERDVARASLVRDRLKPELN
jgi:protein arginine kinase